MIGGKGYFNAYQNPLRPLRGAPPSNTTGKLFMISLNFYVVFGGRVPERMRVVGRVGVGTASISFITSLFQNLNALNDFGKLVRWGIEFTLNPNIMVAYYAKDMDQ